MAEIHKYNVFLSYAFEDRDRAASINTLLEDKGFVSSFSDVNEIYWSSQTSILEAFYNSAVCLFVIGSDQRSPWWDDCIGIAIDERLRSSHGEFRVVAVVFTHKADKRDVWQYSNVPFVSDDNLIHCEDSLIDADKLHELIVLIRGGGRRPKLLADPGLRAWAKLRVKNPLGVDWAKLCYQYSRAKVYRSLKNLLTKASSGERHSVTSSYDESFDTKSDTVTQLLEKWSNGEEEARDKLMPLVYDELHRLAVTYLRRERREHTLQPTALVNELFLKFSEQHNMSWQNRAQFFGVAAQFMRRILVDYARAHYASRRGGGGRYCVSLKNIAAFGAQPDADLLALHEALNGLEKMDPEQARIVELRFFGGLTIKETAEVMQVSHATVEREWRTAKLFLRRELTPERQLTQEKVIVEEITLARPITPISISSSYSLSLEL